MARFVLYEDKIDDVNTDPLMGKMVKAIASDARKIAPVDTGALLETITATVEDGVGYVYAGDSSDTENAVDYAVYQELGTRYMDAQPYLKPATYRYRS